MMTKKIAAINDLSGLGKCSLTAAIPILSVLGIQPCPLPTAVLTGQTGFPHYFIDDYTDKIDEYTNNWHKLGIQFNGIYTGFLANEAQVDKIMRFIDIFQEKNTLLLVDPVMGDNGKIYDTYNDSLCRQMTLLTKRADVITPNLTEACFLANVNYFELTAQNSDVFYLERIHSLGMELIKKSERSNNCCPYTVIITGIKYKGSKDSEEYMYNAAITKNDIFYSKSKIAGHSYSGTGDIFASIVCSFMVLGQNVKHASECAAKFIELAITDTAKNDVGRNYGINFEKYLSLLPIFLNKEFNNI